MLSPAFPSCCHQSSSAAAPVPPASRENTHFPTLLEDTRAEAAAVKSQNLDDTHMMCQETLPEDNRPEVNIPSPLLGEVPPPVKHMGHSTLCASDMQSPATELHQRLSRRT